MLFPAHTSSGRCWPWRPLRWRCWCTTSCTAATPGSRSRCGARAAVTEQICPGPARRRRLCAGSCQQAYWCRRVVASTGALRSFQGRSALHVKMTCASATAAVVSLNSRFGILSRRLGCPVYSIMSRKTCKSLGCLLLSEGQPTCQPGAAWWRCNILTWLCACSTVSRYS
jgi:hypothetical protein